MGKYAGGMRWTTSFDMGPEASGLNDPKNPFRQGVNPLKTEKVASADSGTLPAAPSLATAQN
jgi:alpha-ketoglutarate-dependent 2,4-dichlorophenoxyacetate dioxygenase